MAIKRIIRDVIVSSFVVLVIILCGVLFIKYVIGNETVANYVIDELLGNKARGLLLVFIGTVAVMAFVLCIVEASNIETEKNKAKYEAYLAKKREEESKIAEAKERNKTGVDRNWYNQGRSRGVRRDVTDDFFEQRL